MAKPISDEELQLRKRARRRLIGAIAVVIAVVVALPMVLDNEPKPVPQDIDIRIPSPESAGPFASKVTPPPDAPEPPAGTTKPVPVPDVKAEAKPVVQAGAGAKPVAQAGADAKPEAKREAAAETAKPAPVKTDKPTTVAKAQEPAKPAAARPGQYVIQVVALSDAGKAKRMQQAISKTGVKAYTEVVKTARGDVTRVRVGPYSSRDAAEKAQQKLKGSGFDGKVIPAR